jgi:hypothetical protein
MTSEEKLKRDLEIMIDRFGKEKVINAINKILKGDADARNN